MCLLSVGIGSMVLAEVFAGAREWLVIHRYGQNPGRLTNAWQLNLLAREVLKV